MAESLPEIFGRLQSKQQLLLERYNAMREKMQAATEEIEVLKKENETCKKRLQELETSNEFLQVARQIAPDKEALDRSRSLIAKLVRDIDKCISQLKE